MIVQSFPDKFLIGNPDIKTFFAFIMSVQIIEEV